MEFGFTAEEEKEYRDKGIDLFHFRDELIDAKAADAADDSRSDGIYWWVVDIPKYQRVCRRYGFDSFDFLKDGCGI
jgi:hypothetical protein